MSIEAHNPHALHRHVWTGRRRRIRRIWFTRVGRSLCFIVLVLLAGGIVLYIRLTDPARVRALAEGFFARAVDADVTIGDARLSLFEGLQLDDVTIANHGGGEHATAITAKRLQVSYSPLALLTGRLESGRIVAIEPTVYLVEDVDRGRWNLQDLRRTPTTSQPVATTAPAGPPMQLPEVLIRGGSVVRSQVVGGKFSTLQIVRLEGQLLPRDASDAYHFNLQSRTDQGTAGPTFQGEFSLANSAAVSSLTNVELGFLEPMLPERVREFWQKLSPSGRVDVPVLSFSRGRDDRGGFRIELQLHDVKMIVRPIDWASASERTMLREPAVVAAALRRMPNTLLASVAVTVQPALRTGLVPLDGVNGRFVFTEEGVKLEELAASVDGNPFDIHGALRGYNFDAPMELHVNSHAGQPIVLRDHVPYMNALPAEIREVYYRFAPQGRTKLDVAMTRPATGEPLKASGTLEFANAEFAFQQFRYPVKNASGRLIVDADPRTGEPRLLIDQVHGNGPAEGPNAHGELGVSGVIAPLIGYASVDVIVTGKDIHSEPSLIAALPPEASRVIDEFDDDGPGPNPVFGGDFTCHVRREPGAISHWTYDTDVSVRHARGSLKAFPFPLEDLAVDLQIRKEYVQIVSAKSSHGGGTVEVSGLTEWGKRVPSATPRKVGEPGVRTSLTLKGRGLPIDDALRNALPEDARAILARFGIGGVIDVTGPIVVSDPRSPQFDLTVEARDARFAPDDWKTAIDGIAATLQLTPRTLKLDRAVGKRGDAKVVASGGADWSAIAAPTFDIDADVIGLALDAPLRDSLPTPARSVWDSLQPGGITDARLHLSGEVAAPKWTLDLKPHGATLHPAFFAMPMSDVSGDIHATAERVELDRLEGKVAGGTAVLRGVGDIADRQSWALKLETTDTLIDRALLDALPSALGKTLIENEVAGRADLQFDKLDWTTSPDGKSTDAAFDSVLTLRDVGWRTGFSIDKANGTAVLRGRVVDGEPAELSGDATLKTFRLAGIDAHDGAAAVESDTDGRTILVKGIRAKIGDGDIAGDVTLDRSRALLPSGENRWSANFLLRNADVAELTASSSTKMNGRLNASLALEGGWTSALDTGRPGTARPMIARRGRGDISVTGKEMVNVPMILGMTQVVSLALPFTGGFDEATASYSLDGDRVSFSDISLQSNEMKIKGAGWLDFDRKQVNLDFTTDTTGKKLPVIGNLLDAARRELFQIKVRGTLSEPEVKPGSLRTITTTVDEILNGDKSDKK